MADQLVGRHEYCTYQGLQNANQLIEVGAKESMKVTRIAERGLTTVAGGLFDAIQVFNKFKPNPSFIPKWSDKPLLKSWQKTKPTLGWPRVTDSLCPNCVIEAREEILSGKQDVSVLLNEKVGEIKAQIIERNGEIWMVKDCR